MFTRFQNAFSESITFSESGLFLFKSDNSNPDICEYAPATPATVAAADATAEAADAKAPAALASPAVVAAAAPAAASERPAAAAPRRPRHPGLRRPNSNPDISVRVGFWEKVQ
jgi:hypothetical protein